MKKMIIALLSFVSIHAFADGIPVPMDRQTPYNWRCNEVVVGGRVQQVSLHLIEYKLSNGKVQSELFISNGATIGAGIPAGIAKALKTKSYKVFAQDGVPLVDEGLNRIVNISLNTKLQDVEARIDVAMIDGAGKFKIEAKGCTPLFNAVR